MAKSVKREMRDEYWKLYKIKSLKDLEKERFSGDPSQEAFYLRAHREMVKQHEKKVEKWQTLISWDSYTK